MRCDCGCEFEPVIEYQHRLICGDCTDAAVVARVMDGERAQAVVTDPPYPDEFKHVWVALGSIAYDACEDNAFLSSLCGHYQLPLVMEAISRGGWAWWWLCIATNQMQPIMHGYNVKVCHKPNVVYRKGNAKPRRLYIDDFALRSKTAEWKEAQDAHKWGQAVTLFIEPIEAFSDVSGLIYEPFCGGGTTLIACERLNRRCRAVEIEPGYVAVALQRFYDMTGIEPVLLEPGNSDLTVISNG